MKVLYILTAYDRRAGDGITPWLVETIGRLGEAGVTVEVLAPAYRGQGGGVVEGVRVHRYRYAPARIEDLTHDQTAPDRLRERPLYLALVPGYLAAGALAAARLARRGGFDLVHAHWPLPHAVHGLAARRAARIPLVLTFHGVEIAWARRQLRPLLPWLRHVIRVADAVTANSTYTEALVRGLHDRAVDRIPFGATVRPRPAAAGAPSPAPQDSSRLNLLFVGRLVERKGVDYLLDALARTRGRLDARLRVLGEGPLRAALERRSAELGLEDAVRFEGFVPDAELAAAYAAADVFVLPAVEDAKGDVEGLGVVLVEALAAGVPAVASDAGGIPDIIRHRQTGLLVPPADPDALAAALLELAADPALRRRLAEAGKRHVEAEFSWDVIIDRLLAVYRRVSAA